MLNFAWPTTFESYINSKNYIYLVIIMLKEWTPEEANAWFIKIEDSNGKNETEIIDWKLKLNLKDTGLNDEKKNTNNTTQRAMSGFANTFGGVLVLGFNEKGVLQGITQNDVENNIIDSFNNRKNTNLNKINFMVENYSYKTNNIVVIFIEKSKQPIQCDNGVFYYREQTQFKSMPYYMVYAKFREHFDEKKYIYLTINELQQFRTYIDSKRIELGVHGSTLGYKIDHFVKILVISREKLYSLYNKYDLFYSYFELMRLVNIWIAKQQNEEINYNDCGVLLERINAFFDLLSEIKID